MSTTFDPDLVVAALETALRDLVNDEKVQIDSVSAQSIDADGNFIVDRNAAVLIFFAGETHSEPQDNTKTEYQSEQTYALICGARNLQSTKMERNEVLGLVSKVRKIAGAKLTIGGEEEDPAQLPPIKLLGTEPFDFGKNGSWYAVNIVVEALVQFDSEA